MVSPVSILTSVAWIMNALNSPAVPTLPAATIATVKLVSPGMVLLVQMLMSAPQDRLNILKFSNTFLIFFEFL